MAIASNFPAIKPSLSLDFANTKRLDSRVTFTRTTTATYYDGVTTAKAEENLFLYSQEFDNAAWATLRATVSANSTTAPDGTATADSLTQQTGQTTSGAVYTLANINYIASTYIFSVFAKPNGKNFIRLAMVDGGSVFRECYFNVNSGTVGTANNGAVGTITASANGYYRCSISYTFASASSMSARIFLADVDNSSTVVDSGGAYIWGAQLEQRSSVTAYTATTTQAITNYIPVLLTAASGVARFQHNPTTDESLGLLIEEARTNLMTYSSDFSNAAWVKSRASITSNTIVAPDGTLTGDKLVEDTTATNTHYIVQTYSYTSGTAYNYSFYAKAAERTRVAILAFPTNSVFTSSTAIFNLSTGLITRQDAGFTSASITNVGNGWYRCSIAITAAATATGSIGILLANGDTSVTYTGDGYSGAYIWGAQLEAGAFPTSYIATTSATVTRNADAARMTGSNFTSWYNQGEGAVYTELSSLSPLTGAQSVALNKYPTPWRIESGTTDTIVVWYGIQAELYIGNIYNGLGSVPTGNNKLAASFSTTSGQAASSLNGAAAVSRNGALIGTATYFEIGPELNGTIKKIAYYPTRLTNANLQALTS